MEGFVQPGCKGASQVELQAGKANEKHDGTQVFHHHGEDISTGWPASFWSFLIPAPARRNREQALAWGVGRKGTMRVDLRGRFDFHS